MFILKFMSRDRLGIIFRLPTSPTYLPFSRLFRRISSQNFLIFFAEVIEVRISYLVKKAAYAQKVPRSDEAGEEVLARNKIEFARPRGRSERKAKETRGI